MTSESDQISSLHKEIRQLREMIEVLRAELEALGGLHGPVGIVELGGHVGALMLPGQRDLVDGRHLAGREAAAPSRTARRW